MVIVVDGIEVRLRRPSDEGEFSDGVRTMGSFIRR
jgi:hypothetical protein